MLRLSLVLLALVASVPAATGQTIRSDLRVPARETFVLGGDAGAFRVTARNVGTVAVALVERATDGTETVRGTLAPGARADARFATGSAALVVNRTATEARLDVTIRRSGDSSLGMRYVPTEP